MLACLLAMNMNVTIETSTLVANSWRSPVVVAHRGGAAYRAENTLSAYANAVAMRSKIAETDVHVSQDGEVVVMHDGTLDRTTNLTGLVSQTPWRDMKDAGVPSLRELLTFTKDKINLIVEIKAGKGVEKKVVDMLKEKGMVDQTIVFSFNQDIVRNVKKLNPDQYTVWLSAKAPESPMFWTTLIDLGVDAFGVQFRNCTDELVIEAHARKIPIFVWTVPPGDEVDRLRKQKVNFIITDHPKDVQDQLTRR